MRWLATMGRDNKIIIWKLLDGKIMHSDQALHLFSHKFAIEPERPLQIKQDAKNSFIDDRKQRVQRVLDQHREMRSSLKMISVLEWFYRCSPDK